MIWIALVLAGCVDGPADLSAHRPGDTPLPDLVVPDPDDDLNGLAGLACTDGVSECATEGPYLGKTCCSYGDNLVPLSAADWPDGLELTVDGADLVTCGASGAAWAYVTDPEHLDLTPFPAGARCMHAAFGPPAADGARVVWLVHPGDNTAPTTPRIASYRRTADGAIHPIEELAVGDFLDVAIDETTLFVATSGGIDVHQIEANGQLSLLQTLGVNRLVDSLAAADGYLYIAEADGTLATIDVHDPSGPNFVSSIEMDGRARVLRVLGSRIAVALGTGGMQIFDRTDPAFPAAVQTLSVYGSVQDVSGDDRRIAIATWHDAQLVDLDTGSQVAHQQGAYPHGRTLAVQWQAGLLYTADRIGIRIWRFQPGMVSSTAQTTPSSAFFGVHASTNQLSVRNHGPMNLVIHEALLPDPAFSADVGPVVVGPGETLSFGVSHTGTSSGGHLTLASNAADLTQIPLFVEALPSTGQLDGFEVGKVHVIYALDLTTPLPARVLLDLQDLRSEVVAMHDGAATADEFSERLAGSVALLDDPETLSKLVFSTEFGGPRFAILDKTASVRAVRSHYDPEDLARLVDQLLDE